MATTGKREADDWLRKIGQDLLDRNAIYADEDCLPISEQELVDAAIRFANREEPAKSLWSLMSSLTNARKQWGTNAVHDLVLNEAFDSERHAFRSALSEINRGKPPIGSLSAASRMLLIPTAEIKGRGASIAYSYFPMDVSAALAYVLLLLADQSKPYGRDLCQCRLEDCEKFFFVQKPPTGRPRTAYCSEEHMQSQHQAEATMRVKISRGRRKKGKRR